MGVDDDMGRATGDNTRWDDIGDTVVPFPGEPPAYLEEASRALLEQDLGGEVLREPLQLIDPSDWGDEAEPPHRRWAVDGMVPHGQATLLTGAGSAGKSLVIQLQCTCVALGLPWLGIQTEDAVALYITCEDDDAELWRRQKAICAGLGVTLADLHGKLYLLSLAGKVDNELATFDDRGRIHVADRHRDIQDACARVQARFVALDNTGHFFCGNENDRHQVASFVGLCNGLAAMIGGAVIILGHPNKAGAQFSGSTAWENQVRSRLFMETPDIGEDGKPLDPDVRVISRGKSNYAQKGGEVRCRWKQWTFVVEEADAPWSEIGETAEAARDNDIFMACLRIRNGQLRAVSERQCKTYAPAIFATMHEARGATKKRMEDAMDRLFRLGRIERGEVWKGPDRKPVFGLRETAGNVCGNSADNVREMSENLAGNVAGNVQIMGAGNVREMCGEPAQVLRETAGHTHPLPLKGEGLGPLLPRGDLREIPPQETEGHFPQEPPSWMDEAPFDDSESWRTDAFDWSGE